MPEEPLTLGELQIAKDTMETKARHLRTGLHELRYSGAQDWQARFAEVQSELIAVVTGISRLERRIRAAVEGVEDDSDV
jgi:hypothetical protein